MIRQKLPLVPLMAALVACASTNSVRPTAADAQALRELKLERWPAIYRQGDADALADFLANDFVLIGGEAGFRPKADEVAWLRDNRWSGPEDFVYQIEKVHFITDDAAIIYGVGISTRSDGDGRPCRHSYLSSNTLRRVGDRWQPVTSHVSDAKCEPLAAVANPAN